MKNDNLSSEELIAIRQEIQQLKNKINLIEAKLDIRKWKSLQKKQTETEVSDEDFELSFRSKSDDSIEFRMGEYGMAWLGNIVLLFGISFLVQYLQNSGHLLFSVLIGFSAVAAIYASAYFTRLSYSYLSKLFEYTGHLLLFYVTVRLHFTQTAPLITSETLGLFILLSVLAGLFYLAFSRNSPWMAGMVLVMILISGIISSSVHFRSATSCLAALLSVLLYYKHGWLKLVFVFIFLIYISHLNWLLNNPLMGNSPGFIQSPGLAYLYFIATGFIFSSLPLIPKKENISNEFIIASVIWNGLGFSFLLALIVLTYLSNNYVPVFAAITLLCLTYSILLQTYSDLKITASMYALYGFLAMTVAFYGILLLPKAYLLLSIQSLLVVSMALWFRSRFIVVMNTFLFVMLLLFYLAGKPDLTTTNFSFMLVAFVTARIINWKKERLNIKTEYIRNTYLALGFTMTLIACYHAFPASYITVSWIVAALLFFVMSRLMKNIKYRWLAIATLVASGIKLIFADLSDIDIGFRVLVFLLLAVISITVSILYTRYLGRRKDK
ncbi:MAG: hypothetical protein WAO52_02785 [Prolixibacteraceae bacterium]